MRSVRTCFVFGLILLLICVFNAFTQKNALPEKDYKFTVDNKTQMDFLLGSDTTYLSLKKGDSVRFLGYSRASYYKPHRFLVETYDGQRGFINLANLGLPFVKEKTGDTLYVNKIDFKKWKYLYKDKDGKEKEVGFEKVYPVLSDTLPYLIIKKRPEYYMSPAKFEKMFIGKSLGEVDNGYLPAMQIYREKNGARVSFYGYWILDKKKGYFRHPVVTYNDSLVATGYELYSSLNTNSKLFVKILPFFAPILDCHFLSSLIEDAFYEPAYPGMTLAKADNPNTFFYVIAALALVCGLLWCFMLGALPVLLFGYLIRFRHLFYHLGDSVLVIIAVVLAVVGGYVWSILMLSWGMLWFFVPIILVVAWWARGFTVTPLNTKPHDRCPQCRRLYSIGFDHTELDKEYDKTENRSYTERTYESGRRSWKTWTETKWSDGSTTKSNEKNHLEVDTTRVSGHYKCLVHYRECTDYYKCCGCGHIETISRKYDDVLERQKTGESSSTTTHQRY